MRTFFLVPKNVLIRGFHVYCNRSGSLLKSLIICYHLSVIRFIKETK